MDIPGLSPDRGRTYSCYIDLEHYLWLFTGVASCAVLT